MKRCVYCKSRSEKGSGLTFHKFPIDLACQKKWLKNMKLGKWQPTKYDRVCSKHFTKDCFVRYCSRSNLKKDSVPTIFTRIKQDGTSQRVVIKKQLDTRQIKKKLVPVNMIKRVPTKSESEPDDSAGKDGDEPDLSTKSSNSSSEQENSTIKQATTSKITEKPVTRLSKDTVKSPQVVQNAVGMTKKNEVAKRPVKKAYKPGYIHRPEYECPKCDDTFPVYFAAFKHIQANHLVNDNDEPVLPNSPDLIKPIRTETCATCNKKIRSKEPHSCVTSKPQACKDRYACLGCDQTFNGLPLYQHHVKGMHGDEESNYFFPSRQELNLWKKDLEQQTSQDYVKLNVEKTREIFHCSYQSNSSHTTIHLCPSIFIVKEYATGIHVCHFKQHHGHNLAKEPIERFLRYTINVTPKDEEDLKLEREEENNLLSEFKNIISNVRNASAKVDMATLKELLGKALEMSALIKGIDNEEVTPISLKNLTDAQITKSLESIKPNTVKRKLSPIPKETKKVELKRTRKETRLSIEADTKRNSPALNKTVSFSKNVSKTDETSNKKTESDKNIESTSEIVTRRNSIQSPTSFSESYMAFVDQNFKNDSSTPKIKNVVRKKSVMKTKMGQFKTKPSISPKLSPKSKETEVKLPRKPVLDIQYEVKEQENDCNILILKI